MERSDGFRPQGDESAQQCALVDHYRNLYYHQFLDDGVAYYLGDLPDWSSG